ncbi:MAG: prepilin-type N-terminal cleavage/methylation domain-containing protein [Candidatus Pacebacteria bacterium]|nr:prepilin-type N-terminal cleavage/methylation domain-containing protein [Candidatus Paceibacterota bacterium]
MRYIFSPKKGFSLVEMILYVAISSFVLLSLSLFLTSLLGSRVKNQSISDVNDQGLQVMQMITHTIRNARSVDFPVIGATSTSLSLTVVDPLLSPTVFDIASGTIRIKEGSSDPIPLTNSHVAVSSFIFQNISSISSLDRIVRISFTVDHVNNNARNENSFTKNFIGSATLRQ